MSQEEEEVEEKYIYPENNHRPEQQLMLGRAYCFIEFLRVLRVCDLQIYPKMIASLYGAHL